MDKKSNIKSEMHRVAIDDIIFLAFKFDSKDRRWCRVRQVDKFSSSTMASRHSQHGLQTVDFESKAFPHLSHSFNDSIV